MCDDDFRPLLAELVAELEADGVRIYFEDDGTFHVIRGRIQ
jgi:hypothetical protein